MRVVEAVQAWGHPNVTGDSRKTFEITTEPTLTRRGDCILAVNASKGAAALRDDFKALARRDDVQVTVVIQVAEMEEAAVGWGSPQLTYTHPTSFVARTSDFTCSRTLMIRSNKAAADFSRCFIRRLQDPRVQATIHLIAAT